MGGRLDDRTPETERFMVVCYASTDVPALAYVDGPIAHVIENVYARFRGAFIVVVQIEVDELH
jgi:hypothetical protein